MKYPLEKKETAMLKPEEALACVAEALYQVGPHSALDVTMLDAYSFNPESPEEKHPVLGLQIIVDLEDGQPTATLKRYINNGENLTATEFAMWCHGYISSLHDAVMASPDESPANVTLQ